MSEKRENPTILLVDDVDFFLELERDYLKNTPATIVIAKNGKDALQLAKDRRPNLIFMDVNMPVMDGLQACRELKGDPDLCSIPVVIVYAPSRDVNDEVCRRAGCDALLTKPVDRNAFLETGHRFLFHVERREPRVPCQTTVNFHLEGEDHQGLAVNISENGLYVQFRKPVKPETRITVSFYLPTVSFEVIQAKGRLAWVNQGFPRQDLALPQGFGVQFVELSSQGSGTIRKFIEKYGQDHA